MDQDGAAPWLEIFSGCLIKSSVGTSPGRVTGRNENGSDRQGMLIERLLVVLPLLSHKSLFFFGEIINEEEKHCKKVRSVTVCD
jgi:hypothetical protein